MKKTYIIKLILPIAAVLLAALSCFAIYHGKQSSVTAELITGTQIKSIYAKGETLEIPSASIRYGEKVYDCEKYVLTFPDGKAYSDAEYVLSAAGKYALIYYATANGKSVSCKKEFLVSDSAFSVGSEFSSAYYGNTGDKGNVNGIIVELVPGDRFRYNAPLDLRGNGARSILSLFTLPKTEGVADVKSMKITLTDVYDENNFVEIITYANVLDANEEKGYALYSGARANGQPLTGMHYKYSASSSTITYEGQLYTIYEDVCYTVGSGYPSFAFSLAAKKGYCYQKENEQFAQPYNLRMDYEERKIFLNNLDPVTKPPSNNLVADLNDSLFFNSLWKGFTNGEAYLSVESDDYVGSAFGFVITDIMGRDLTETDFIPDKIPEIEVDEGKDVFGIVGMPFRLFGAKAYSADGIISCNALVYKDYFSTEKRLCNVKDGCFVPEKKGDYSIVYSAKDSYGNCSEKVINVPVKQTRTIRISLEGEQSESLTGKLTRVKTPYVINANGKYVLRVTASLNNVVYSVSADENGEYGFVPMCAGEYTINYVVTDYNGEYSSGGYKISVTNNPNPIFEKEPPLPEVFVKNAEYVLPNSTGYSFKDGTPAKIVAETFYSFDKGEFREYKSGALLKITAKESVSIKYKLSEASQKTVIIPVTDVGVDTDEYDVKSYFYGEDFLKSATDSETVYTTVKDARLYFVKPLLISDFNFTFSFASAQFKEMRLSLINHNDKNDVLPVSIKKVNDNKLSVTVGGGKAIEINKKLTGQKFAFKYSAAVNEFRIDGVKCEADGFKGFADKKAYFAIDFFGVDGKTELNVHQLNNKFMNDQTSDYANAVYDLGVDFGARNTGDEIKIKYFEVADVIRFETVKKLSVIDPDGDYCVDENGVLMKDVKDFSAEYVIKTVTSGMYTVRFTYGDGFNSNTVTREITVSDNVAPIIRLGDGVTNVRKGETVTVKSAAASDNEDGELSVSIFVMDTESKVKVAEGNKFKADKSGVYTVLYFCQDSSGNVGFAKYEITVS